MTARALEVQEAQTSLVNMGKAYCMIAPLLCALSRWATGYLPSPVTGISGCAAVECMREVLGIDSGRQAHHQVSLGRFP